VSNWRLGLTGGIGCGKSTVAALFAEQGVVIIDADQIARQVVEPETPALAQICQHFGPEMLTPDGSLNRQVLRQHIFAHPTDRAWLNQLLHPLIREEMAKEADSALSPYAILMIPLLFENGLQALVQRTLVIDVQEETQIARVCSRDGNSPELVRQIMQAQMSRAERLALADDILENDTTTLTLLREKVIHLHHNYLELAAKFGS
jgi:dephospho-CoA kinase